MSSDKNGCKEGMKPPYMKYRTWAKDKFWLNGQYSEKGIAIWEEFLENMKKEAQRKNKDINETKL